MVEKSLLDVLTVMYWCERSQSDRNPINTPTRNWVRKGRAESNPFCVCVCVCIWTHVY